MKVRQRRSRGQDAGGEFGRTPQKKRVDRVPEQRRIQVNLLISTTRSFAKGLPERPSKTSSILRRCGNLFYTSDAFANIVSEEGIDS